MRPIRLSVVLILVISGLLIAASVALAGSAAKILSRIAEDGALAGAKVAASAVVEGVQRKQDDLAASAKALAERPSLVRAVAARDLRGAAALLDRMRLTAGFLGCHVVANDTPLVASGEPLPADVLSLAHARVPAILRLDADGRHALLFAFAQIPGVPGAAFAASQRIETLPQTAQAQPPVVSVLSRESVALLIESPRSGLRNSVLVSGGMRAARVGDALVAVAALRSAGEIVGVAEAEASRHTARLTVRRWVRDVRSIAAVVVAIGIVAGFLLGRRLTTPLQALARAAERIGLGDLETAVPQAPGRETGTLSRVMEEMRLRLLDASAQLRRRQAEADAVLGGIAEGVFAVDGERRIRYLNPQAATLFGADARAIEGRFCGDVLLPEPEDGERPCENNCPILRARSGTPSRAVERLRCGGAEARAVVVASSPPVEGRQFVLVRDETESEATRRLRDTVVSNISHEFKTPLAAQLASIELLRDRLDALTPAEARDLVLSMERGALRLSRLIDNLLESVRLDAGEAGIRHAPVVVDEIVEDAAESMRPLLEQKGQRLEIDLPHPLPAVTGDGPRLTQVIVNLLANAHKFSPAGSTIRIGGSVAAPGVTVWVADDGPGLPDGVDIWGRFVRRAGDEPEQSGLGLGLWISKSIVERHGGRIWSAPVPRGTRMCVSLPEATR